MSLNNSKNKILKSFWLILVSLLVVSSSLLVFLEKYSAVAKNDEYLAWQRSNGEIRLGVGENEESSLLVYSLSNKVELSTYADKQESNSYREISENSVLTKDQLTKIKKIIYNGYKNPRLSLGLSDDEFRSATQYALWSVFTSETNADISKFNISKQQVIRKLLSEEGGALEPPLNLKLRVYKNTNGNILIFSQLIDEKNNVVNRQNIMSTIYAKKLWNEFDDDKTTIELQIKDADGIWKKANVKDATKEVEITEDEKESIISWENIIGYPSDYRVVEKTEDREDVLSSKGNGDITNPYLLERGAGNEAISDSFLRANSISTNSGKTGKFTLIKRDENNSPLAGATFTLLKDNQKVQEKVSTSSSSGVVFDNISEGTYMLKETKAPDGYELSKDYYTITVDRYGIARARYVQTETSAESSDSRTEVKPVAQPISARAAKTSDVVEVTSYSLTSTDSKTNHNGIEGVWATSGELIRLTFDLRVKEGTRPGDSFVIKLDEKLSPTGIRERILPPVPLTANGQVAATGEYDQTTNSFIYTFTDYIGSHKNVTLKAQYDTFGADIAKVLNTGEYEFTNVIDGKQQPSKKFYIDYGTSREMPSGLNKGLKMRNQVALVDRVNGVVERIIYLNNGATTSDYVNKTGADHYLQINNKSSDSSIEKVEVYRVPLSKKKEYMADSMPGKVEGLEKLEKSFNTSTNRLAIAKSDFNDTETGYYSAGLVIKITEKLSNLRGQTHIEAIWGYNAILSTSVGASASVVDTGASSSGDSARWSPTISVINKKSPEKKKEFSLKILKRDVADENKKDLKATFALYNESGTEIQKDSSGKQYTGTTEGSEASLNFENIKSGTYLLKETKSPDGYSGIKDLKVTIGEDGNISVEGADGHLANVQKTDGDSVITITIKNIKKGTYPSTGGIGVYIFFIGGIFLIGTAIYTQRKKKEIGKINE